MNAKARAREEEKQRLERVAKHNEFLARKRSHEIVFINWILSFEERNVHRFQFCPIPSRGFDHHGDPEGINWVLNIQGGKIVFQYCYYEDSETVVENKIRVDIQSSAMGIYDYDGCDHNEAQEVVTRMRSLVAIAESLVSDAPLPIEASWRKRDGSSYWTR